MKRTTVYFPEEMKSAIEREALRRGVTEAEVIRGAVEGALGSVKKKKLQVPVFPEGWGENVAGRVDELLEGMGSDGLED